MNDLADQMHKMAERSHLLARESRKNNPQRSRVVTEFSREEIHALRAALASSQMAIDAAPPEFKSNVLFQIVERNTKLAIVVLDSKWMPESVARTQESGLEL